MGIDDRLLILLHLIAKADEAVFIRLAGYGIGDDFSWLAWGEAELKLRDENEIVNLGTKVTDENAVVQAVIFAANYWVRCFEKWWEDTK